MSNYALCQSQTGSKASDELFIACREPAADAACRRRGSSRILLRSATCLGVLRVSSLTVCTRSQIERRTDARGSARFFNSTFVVAFQAANTAGGKRDARKRQCRRGGKQYRHKSKQSEYIAIHEPVPRLTLIE